uniref:Uncharacterized protein n=1 Tax=Solanum lycopersicum TaxID=4081 RepID=A0A3Q7J2Q9_SOLLC
MARDLISDGIEVLQFPVENDGEFVFCPGYAKVVIQKENPIVHDVRLLFPGMPMPHNYVCGRVFLVVNFQRVVQHK